MDETGQKPVAAGQRPSDPAKTLFLVMERLAHSPTAAPRRLGSAGSCGSAIMQRGRLARLLNRRCSPLSSRGHKQLPHASRGWLCGPPNLLPPRQMGGWKSCVDPTSMQRAPPASGSLSGCPNVPYRRIASLRRQRGVSRDQQGCLTSALFTCAPGPCLHVATRQRVRMRAESPAALKKRWPNGIAHQPKRLLFFSCLARAGALLAGPGPS